MQSIARANSIASKKTDCKRANFARLILPAAMALHPYFVMADWSDTKALREQLGTLVAEVEAINLVAKEEKRDLSAEESARVDAILGAGEKTGMVGDLQAKIAQREKIENARDRIAANIGGGNGPTGGRIPATVDDNVDDRNAGILARVKVPSSVSRPATMKAHTVFDTRSENERAAYAMGRFALATIAKHESSIIWCKEHGVITDGMTEAVPADGGYLVPTELSRTVEYWRDLHGVFRSEASYERMMADTKDVAVQTGGLPYFFIGEGVAITDTGKLQFKNVALVAKKVTTIARMTSEVAEDAIIDLGEAVVMAIGEAFALCEDHCGFIADATGTYGSHSGIFNEMIGKKGLYVPAGISTLEDLTNEHFRTIISMIPGKYRQGCKWYCNSTVYDAAMAPILDAAGGNTQSDLEAGPGRLRFKGYDVRETQVLPDAVAIEPTDNVLVFGNMRAGAKFGDRRTMTISRSDQVYWTTDEIGIKGTQRFNAKIHEPGTAGVVGAYVVLQLAAGA